MTEQDRFSMREERRRNFEDRRKMHFERHAQQRLARCQGNHQPNKSWIGVGIILVGIVWLVNVFGAPMPEWVFTWPVLLIAIGLFTGLASRFHNFGSIVMIFIGLAFLARDSIWPDVDVVKYLWPVLIIGFGITFLFKRHYWEKRERMFRQQYPEWKNIENKWHQWNEPSTKEKAESQNTPFTSSTPSFQDDPPSPGSTGMKNEQAPGMDNSSTQLNDDWIDITTIFGGSRRNVISKNFRGGDLTNICGGTIIDLRHADLNGTAVIDVVGIWGGIKIVVPPNWEVRLNVTHLMAGTDDRRGSVSHDPGKVLILTGLVLMAGIEISEMP